MSAIFNFVSFFGKIKGKINRLLKNLKIFFSLFNNFNYIFIHLSTTQTVFFLKEFFSGLYFEDCIGSLAGKDINYLFCSYLNFFLIKTGKQFHFEPRLVGGCIQGENGFIAVRKVAYFASGDLITIFNK
jgi:hypothetical protein